MHSPLSTYETGAKLPSLTPLYTGAPRSARTFVSRSSGGRLSYLSYRGMNGAHGWTCTSTAFRPQRSQRCASAFSPRGLVGTHPRTRTENIRVLSAARLPLHQVGIESWYAPRDSNPDCAGFKAAASAVGLGAQKLAPRERFELSHTDLGGPAPSDRPRYHLAASAGFEPASVGLEGPTPCPTARL